jgi:hypothetical protein
MSHSKYSSIDSLRICLNDIKYYYEKNNYSNSEKIQFYGTVKLHGTNGSVGYNNIDKLWCQSRTSIITPKKDNMGFAEFIEKNNDKIMNLIFIIKDKYNINLDTHSIIIFGEWCGNGIQNNVAINQMEKFYAIFDIKIVEINDKENAYYLDSKFPEIKSDTETRIFNIHEFKTYNITFDIENLNDIQNELTEYITEIEKQCPFAEYFGIKGIGEGIVFRYYFNDKNRFIFKVKGEQHKVSKEKVKIELTPEKLSSYNNFIERVVTENRFQQALEYIYKINPTLETYNKKPMQKDISTIIEWIMNDIIKEENDIIKLNDFDKVKIKKMIGKKVYSLFNLYIATN